MTDNDKKFLEHWKKQREKGFYRFSVVTGGIYAVFVFIVKKIFDWDFSFVRKDLYMLATALLIGILILGPFLWWNRERKYKSLTAKSSSKKSGRKNR